MDCDYLKLWQVAYLLIDQIPPDQTYLSSEDKPDRFVAAKTILWNAFDSKEIEGKLAQRIGLDNEGEPVFYDEIEQQFLTELKVSSVLKYLDRKSMARGFLKSPSEPDYSNPVSDFYAPKLTAAIAAWKAVSSDEKLMAGKSVKQALMKWLEDHNKEFKLKDKGIEEAATVANWRISGGAPKTPSNKT